MRNIKIVVEYEGTNYNGWQWQPNGVTIQQILEERFAVITQEKIKLVGSGRTDAGVHAIGQVANFKTETAIPCENLLRGVNSLLPKDIAVRGVTEVDDTFHARYNAKSKIYVYKIYNSAIRSALYRNYTWHVYDSLNSSAMEATLSILAGTHDFSSFCGADDDAVTHVRTINNTAINVADGGMIIVSVEANGFLRHMVRNIVGTLVAVGKGKLSKEECSRILEAKDRTKAGVTAPPQGLYLKEVRY